VPVDVVVQIGFTVKILPRKAQVELEAWSDFSGRVIAEWFLVLPGPLQGIIGIGNGSGGPQVIGIEIIQGIGFEQSNGAVIQIDILINEIARAIVFGNQMVIFVIYKRGCTGGAGLVGELAHEVDIVLKLKFCLNWS